MYEVEGEVVSRAGGDDAYTVVGVEGGEGVQQRQGVVCAVG